MKPSKIIRRANEFKLALDFIGLSEATFKLQKNIYGWGFYETLKRKSQIISFYRKRDKETDLLIDKAYQLAGENKNHKIKQYLMSKKAHLRWYKRGKRLRSE